MATGTETVECALERENMSKLKVWHGEKHDGFTTTEIEFSDHISAKNWTNKVFRKGGFWTNEHPVVFVPWHRISYIELDLGGKQ